MRRTSSSTTRHYPLLHALLALTSLLIHLSTVCSGLESIGPITTKSIDMTLIGVDESEQYREWQTVTADFIMNYFKNSENVKDVQVECAMLYETVTEIPIGTYTGNAGVPGSEWTLGGGRRRLAESVRFTYNQITSYKTEDPTVYDETYMVEEPFRGDPQGYIAKLKRSSKNGHYDPVVEVGVGIPPPTPPPTLKPKRVPSPSAKKKSSGGGDSMLYIIIGVACGGVLIMMLAGGLIIRRRRKSRGLGGAPQNIMVGSNNPQNPPHSIFTGSTPQTMSTGVESGNNSWQSGNMNNMQAVTGIAATPPIMMQDREEVLPSGEVRNHIIAPKGKLGITLENLPWGGPSYVAKVSGKSPLFGRVQIGDKVMAIDGDDVQQVSAKDISKLLARKKKNPQRQITIMRGESKGNNDNQVQPNQNVSGGMNNMGNGPYSRQGSQMDDRGVLPNHSNDSFFTGMNNMGNDPYGIRREGSFRDDRHYQPNHGLSRSMNSMGNDPYAMMREESRRDHRHFHPNHGLSRSMNMMGNDPYGMGREGMQRDDRYWQRSHSVSDMNNMYNDPYGMGREGSWRDNRDIHLNRSAHGIRGEASWRDDHQFQRRRTVSDVDNDPYGMGRDGRRREDRHFQRSDSVSSGMTMTMDGDPYRSGREGRQREDRDFDFNHSAPGGMNMDNDLCEIERERGRREDRDFDFNHSAPGGMNMDSDPYEIGREGGRREDRDFHPRHSAPPLMDSDIIDPHSHEGNNHFTVEPAAQDVDSKYDAITVVAPKGKLGFVLEDSSDDGPSFISEIHEDSVLKGEIVLFDRIASVDDQDVKELKAFHISKLLAHKGRNDERKIVFLREKNEGGQNKFMV